LLDEESVTATREVLQLFNASLANLAVVFVAVDAARLLVLLLMDGLAVRFGEVAIVLSAHAPLFFVDSRFLMLQAGSFPGSKLTALDALSDAILLVDLALVNVVVMLTASRSGLREDCSGVE
jgi:hypothetical protein